MQQPRQEAVANTDTAQTEMESQIERRASSFDLCALVDLLHHIGYRDEEIEYRSHDSLVHQGALISRVVFRRTSPRRVFVSINLGWLSTQSPLPNYFRKTLSAQRDESLSDFLGLFCHRLLRGTVVASFPERDDNVFRDWPRALAQLRSLLGLRSTYTIHWVFCHIFPELEVAVGRSVIDREVRTQGMVLGDWNLGDGSVCGGVTRVPVSAVAITLFADDAVCGRGVPWSTESEHRLRNHVLPALAAHGSFLDVKLVLRDQKSFLTLVPKKYLGYEPIQSPEPQDPLPPKSVRTIVIFQGEARTPSSSS